MLSPESLSFLEKWQTLIGSALGPFLAVIFSAIGFWIKSKIDEWNELKETARRLEIGVTRSMNDTYVAREQARRIIKSIKLLAADAAKITDDKTFFLERVNFPTIREVYRDIELPTLKIKSYYLHNNLLFMDAYVKQFNETCTNFKDDFERLLKQNEFHVALKDNPKNQRKTYIDDLTHFAEVMDGWTTETTQISIKMMMQMKVYNQRLRAHPVTALWKFEGTSFRIFRSKKELNKFSRNLDSLTRIDLIIKEEVENEIASAESKSPTLIKDNKPSS